MSESSISPIKRIRRGQGISQWDLASRIGRTGSWVSLVEKGYVKPDDELLEKIAQVLGVSIAELHAEEGASTK